MTFMLGNTSNSTKTEFRSKSRILFVFLIIITVFFVLGAQVEWVPYLSYSSSPSEKSDGILLEEEPLHKGSNHVSIPRPQSLDPSPLIPSQSVPAPVHSTTPIGGHDGSDTDGKNSQSTVAEDDINNSNGNGNEHEYDPAPSRQLDGNKERNPFLSMIPDRPPMEGEKFLAYLPHSGFHNQLITLENALRLAAYLNRTLLLPPLHLSHKLQALLWKEPPILLQQWAERNRTDVGYCREIDTSAWPRKTKKQREAMTEIERKTERECLFYHSWTVTPWTYFYNIPKLLAGVVDAVPGQTEPIRVFNRPVMSLDWLYEHLEIKDPDTEVYFYNDTSRYAYRIVDDSEVDYGNMPETEEQRLEREREEMIKQGFSPHMIEFLGRYDRELLLTDIQKRPEKVLHFGSLFATDRVDAQSEKNKALQNYIYHGMELWNQAILDATNLAEEQINFWKNQTGRAAPGFLGVHFRTEDGFFEKLVPRNLQRIIAWLGEMSKRDRTTYMAGKRATMSRASSPVVTRRQEYTVPPFLERCAESPPESPMIFMATDVHRPRESPILQDLLDQYPCTMFLSDFTESIAILDSIRNPVDGVHMLPYMIALMDANLAAKGREFQGTERSTFTAYIVNHLWPEYHPDHVKGHDEALP